MNTEAFVSFKVLNATLSRRQRQSSSPTKLRTFNTKKKLLLVARKITLSAKLD
jgi:hypothetical protein